jgi:hypothetical protein
MRFVSRLALGTVALAIVLAASDAGAQGTTTCTRRPDGCSWETERTLPVSRALPVYREGLGRRLAYCRAIAIRTASSGETR